MKSKIKKKVMPKVLIVAILTVMLSSQAYAAWYYSEITLPRNGWWYSVVRIATSNRQQTIVRLPEYDVVSNIASTKDKDFHSTNKTHKAGQAIIQDHYTGLDGEDIRAAFRSSIINQRTNRAELGWGP